MNFFIDYAKERLGVDTVETDFGFVQYKINGEEVFISDVYVAPEFRGKPFNSGHPFWRLGDKVVEIAKEKGCKILSARVVPSLPHAETVLYCHIVYGMKIHHTATDEIVTFKEI